MEASEKEAPHLAVSSKRLAQRMLVVCENRVELLLLEVQQEREQILRAVWLGLGAAVFGLLAGVALTAVVAVAFWQRSPVVALLILAFLYTVAGLILYARLAALKRGWQMLPATQEQLRKDGECLKKTLH